MTSTAQTWEEKITLKADPQGINDNFGKAVAISENFAAVGATPTTGSYRDVVFLYKKNSDGTYSLIQKIRSSDVNDPFVAYSLALSDNFLVIGDANPVNQVPAGAYVYERGNDGIWRQVQKLQGSDAVTYEMFGSAIAIEGSTIVIGASAESVVEYKDGAAYVFVRDLSGQWQQTQRLTTNDPGYQDGFGTSVAINNGNILVGAPYQHNGTPDPQGALYIFKKNGAGNWNQMQKITPPVGSAGARFGWSVGVSGDHVVVGAKTENYSQGAVYFFKNESGQLAFKQKLLSPTSTQNSFGQVVVISEDRAVVTEDVSSSTFAFYYTRDVNGVWSLASKIYGPPYTNFHSESFGYSAAISGTQLIIGAPAAVDTTVPSFDFQTGEAHIYNASSKPLPFVKSSWIDIPGNGNFPFLVDFDNDGDLDISVSYENYSRPAGTELYRLNGSQYVKLSQTLPNLQYNSGAAWIDLNGDGWLDFLIRRAGDNGMVSELYENNRGINFTMVDVSARLLDAIWEGDFHFADYDNDADLDLLVQQKTEPGFPDPKALLLVNDGKFRFTKSETVFAGRIRGNPWIDVNNDGYKDFVLARSVDCNTYRLSMFINNGGKDFKSFETNVSALNSSPTYGTGDAIVGDYDNDGDDDIIWSGQNGCNSGIIAGNVIVSDAGILKNGNVTIQPYWYDACLNLGDFDNDGIPDLLGYGDPMNSIGQTKFFTGTGAGFQKLTLNETPTSLQGGGAALGDVDNDGDLDALILGNVNPIDGHLLVYRNNATEGWTTRNTPPSVPTSMTVSAGGLNSILISWNSASDDTTPAKALTYNIVLTRNDTIVISGASNQSGVRQRFVPGNVGHRTSIRLQNLKPGNYKASVQAIDNSSAGSAFSSPVSFRPDLVLGIDSPNEKSLLQIYPNPTRRDVEVVSSSGPIMGITLYDLYSRPVRQFSGINSNSFTIPTIDLPSGIYVASVFCNGQVVTRRVIKE